MKIKNIPITFIILSLPIISTAQSRIYVNEYLNIGVGARGLSMGGAQSASTHDVYATYWNPAGLAQMQNNAELGLMHSEYFGGIFKYDYGGLAIKLKDKKRAIGVSFIRFATDNIPYTLDYVQPDGSFDESKLKAFSAGDYAFTFSYAQQLGWFKNKKDFSASFGANAKVIYRNVGSMANAWGAGVDLGLQIKAKQWYFGIMAKDITTTITSWSFHLTEKEKETFSKTGNEIPIKSYEVMNPRINLGIGRHFINPKKDFQLGAEIGLDVTTDGKRIALISSKQVSVDPRMGLEASYKNTIFLRGGISNMYHATDNADTTNTRKYFVFQPAVGVGFKLKQLHIDYAFTSLNMQDNPLYSHVVSLKLNFNKAKKANPEAEAIPPAPVTPAPAAPVTEQPIKP
ncbi:PorV/PorQ family protein [Taibaiella sp. KBW10]|uniref:putative type IX sorting system protein PorV2 n=1 Tax=Taibaiella sp. KBW10 TaxID=2153357 RepID=UPI000F5B4AED|nr:PorV/PorQ family protein [Taibaiella sp. KBW10]